MSCENETWYLLALLVYSLVEYFVGKSKKTTSNSVVELILTLGRRLYERKRRRERNS